MFKHLTGDILPRARCKGKDVAIAMAELALATQDFDLIEDIRILNGRRKNTFFDGFWSEIKSLLESHARVDDRGHGKKMMYLHTYMVLKTKLKCAYAIVTKCI